MKRLNLCRVDKSINGNDESGFTLIELTVSMFFVAFIVTILATSLTNIMQTYNKGVWLSQINQAGRQLSRDISNQVRYSGVLSTESRNAISAQRLCVGGISYIWNLQSQVDTSTTKNSFGGEAHSNKSALRLVRVNDPDGKYCQKTGGKYPAVKRDKNVRNLLGQGVSIEEFKVEQGVNGHYEFPILSIYAVIGTKGFDRPIKAKDDGGGRYTIVSADSGAGKWQCGEWIDNDARGIKGVPDPEDSFTPAKNQRCAFLKFNYTVYERVVPE